MKWKSLSHVRLFVTHVQSMEFSRPEYWVAFPFSGGIFPTRWTQVSHIAGGFFTSWATGEAQGTAYLG